MRSVPLASSEPSSWIALRSGGSASRWIRFRSLWRLAAARLRVLGIGDLEERLTDQMLTFADCAAESGAEPAEDDGRDDQLECRTACRD